MRATPGGWLIIAEWLQSGFLRYHRLARNADDQRSPSLTASPSGLTIGAPTIAGNVVTVIMSGGVSGTLYEVAFEITTADGFQFMRTVSLQTD